MGRRKKSVITLKRVVILLVCFLVYASTFGWRNVKVIFSSQSKEHETIAKNLRKHVYALSHQIGWRGMEQYEDLQKAAQYIKDSLTQLGYVVETQDFIVRGKTVSNIIVQKISAKSPEKIMIVGANYDSYFNPGADNNASGVAALLELADLLSKEEFPVTVRLVALVNKEPPFFATADMGSAVYAKHLKTLKENIQGVILLDSIGYYSDKGRSQRYPWFLGFLYPGKANFITLVGNAGSQGFLKTLDGALKKELSFPVQSVLGFDFINSDNISFWREGYKAVLVTDTGGYRNPDRYSLADTYKKLNYLNMAQIVKGLCRFFQSVGQE